MHPIEFYRRIFIAEGLQKRLANHCNALPETGATRWWSCRPTSAAAKMGA
jgi:hypothetical protein